MASKVQLIRLTHLYLPMSPANQTTHQIILTMVLMCGVGSAESGGAESDEQMHDRVGFGDIYGFKHYRIYKDW